MPDLVMSMYADVRSAVAYRLTDLEQDGSVTLGGDQQLQLPGNLIRRLTTRELNVLPTRLSLILALV